MCVLTVELLANVLRKGGGGGLRQPRASEWGQEVVAFVVPIDHGEPPALRALRDHVRQVLPAYAAPRALVVLDALPRTLIGKTIRSQLLLQIG